eukprot:2318920-Amphidinium_carterae.1
MQRFTVLFKRTLDNGVDVQLLTAGSWRVLSDDLMSAATPKRTLLFRELEETLTREPPRSKDYKVQRQLLSNVESEMHPTRFVLPFV